MRNLSARAVFGALLLVGLAASCGSNAVDSGGSGGAAQTTTTTGDFVLRPTLVPGLFSFSAVIDELHLVTVDGVLSANLLQEPLPLELLHLTDRHAWISRATFSAQEEYASVSMSFVPGSFEALDADGQALDVSATTESFLAPIANSPFNQSYARFELLLDLRAGLTIDAAAGTALLEPEGSAFASDGNAPLALDVVLGLVRQRDTGTGRIVMDAFASQDRIAPIGRVDVQVAPLARLVDTNNQLSLNPSFFLTFMTPGSTLIDVAGSLGAHGELSARRVELEDQVPQIGGVFPVMLEGRVVEVGPSFTIRLQLRDIPRGRSLVQPYIDAQPDPSTVLISYDPTLALFFVGQNQLISPDNLAVGQDLVVKSRSFSGAPFPAWRMDITSAEPAVSGVVTSTAGLPQSFVIAGSGFSALTVELDDALVLLDTLGLPLFALDDLLPGLQVVVNGLPVQGSGPPTVVSGLVRVIPGRLNDARISGFVTSTQSMQTQGGEIVDPFGADLTVGPTGATRILLDRNPLVLGAASSVDQLFELLAQPGANYAVDVSGVSTGVTGELWADILLVMEL